MTAEQALTIMAGEMDAHLDQHFLRLFKAMLFEAVA